MVESLQPEERTFFMRRHVTSYDVTPGVSDVIPPDFAYIIFADSLRIFGDHPIIYGKYETFLKIELSTTIS
jgi:hypothetical protein